MLHPLPDNWARSLPPLAPQGFPLAWTAQQQLAPQPNNILLVGSHGLASSNAVPMHMLTAAAGGGAASMGGMSSCRAAEQAPPAAHAYYYVGAPPHEAGLPGVQCSAAPSGQPTASTGVLHQLVQHVYQPPQQAAANGHEGGQDAPQAEDVTAVFCHDPGLLQWVGTVPDERQLQLFKYWADQLSAPLVSSQQPAAGWYEGGQRHGQEAADVPAWLHTQDALAILQVRLCLRACSIHARAPAQVAAHSLCWFGLHGDTRLLWVHTCG